MCYNITSLAVLLFSFKLKQEVITFCFMNDLCRFVLLCVVTLSCHTGPLYCKRSMTFFFFTTDNSRLSCSIREQWPTGALESSLMFSLRTVIC